MVVRQAAPEEEAEPLVVPEPDSGAITVVTKAEVSEIQISTWNLGERISIAPQMWDADMPQVGEGAARPNSEVEIMTFKEEEEIMHVLPEPLRKSLKEKWKRKRRKSCATGIRGSNCHQVQDDRLRTNRGSYRRGRKAG
jgi:hypothetical protein